jgi:crossover junction endodeoxyribonuclease RuvC
VVIEDGRYLTHIKMPVGGGTKKKVLGAELARWLAEINPKLVVIEQVASRPGQGVVSMFSFGHACGVVDGVVSALQMSKQNVTPQVWKSRLGLSSGDKDDARLWAIQRFPEAMEHLTTKARGQALADALGIALWGERC